MASNQAGPKDVDVYVLYTKANGALDGNPHRTEAGRGTIELNEPWPASAIMIDVETNKEHNGKTYDVFLTLKR